MIIHQATEKDLEAASALYADLVRYEARFEKKDMLREMKLFRSRFLKDIKTRKFVCFLALENGRPVALADAHSYDLFKFSKNTGYVRNVFVRKSYRRKGIGKELLAKVEKWMKSQGLKKVVIDTYENNRDAVLIWEALGFTPVKNHRQFLRLEKQLKA